LTLVAKICLKEWYPDNFDSKEWYPSNLPMRMQEPIKSSHLSDLLDPLENIRPIVPPPKIYEQLAQPIGDILLNVMPAIGQNDVLELA
jgi:hypothetical protein